MRVVANFDPSAAASDTFNAGFSNGTGRIVVYNESNINLLLSWGSFSTYCPAWTAMLYCITTNNVNIGWEQQSTLVSSGAPISQVIVEAYADYEQIMGTFPAALVRQTNIGNTVNTVGGSSNSIQNDNNAAGTSIVEATVTGDAGSAVSLLNTGVLVLGNASHHGSISSDNALFQSDGAGVVTVQTLKPNMPGILVNNTGGSGTAKIYQWCQGHILITWVFYQNFKNVASDIVVSLPVAYSNITAWRSTDIPGIQAWVSSMAINQGVNAITTWAAGGGSITGGPSMNKYGQGDIVGGFDALKFSSLNGSTHTGYLFLEGVNP